MLLPFKVLLVVVLRFTNKVISCVSNWVAAIHAAPAAFSLLLMQLLLMQQLIVSFLLFVVLELVLLLLLTMFC